MNTNPDMMKKNCLCSFKGRNVIEHCINRLKDFRAAATRYDKCDRNYLAGVLVASIILWL